MKFINIAMLTLICLSLNAEYRSGDLLGRDGRGIRREYVETDRPVEPVYENEVVAEPGYVQRRPGVVGNTVAAAGDTLRAGANLATAPLRGLFGGR